MYQMGLGVTEKMRRNGEMLYGEFIIHLDINR